MALPKHHNKSLNNKLTKDLENEILEDRELKNKITFIFDIETNGLPEQTRFRKFYDPSNIEKYENSRMIEIAYKKFNGTKLLCTKSFLIKPDNFMIDNSSFHGITYNNANMNGLPIREVLEKINIDLEDVDVFVSHNIEFDINILLSECYRYNEIDLIDSIDSKYTYCTMLNSTNLNNGRWLKLVKLYKILFNKHVTQQHRALPDVKLCSQCYFELIK